MSKVVRSWFFRPELRGWRCPLPPDQHRETSEALLPQQRLGGGAVIVSRTLVFVPFRNILKFRRNWKLVEEGSIVYYASDKSLLGRYLVET